ncbi:hypothetical protein A3Q56_08732, partial [Intoshia linei]
ERSISPINIEWNDTDIIIHDIPEYEPISDSEIIQLVNERDFDVEEEMANEYESSGLKMRLLIQYQNQYNTPKKMVLSLKN